MRILRKLGKDFPAVFFIFVSLIFVNWKIQIEDQENIESVEQGSQICKDTG